MGLFSKLFSKPIVLPQGAREDIVSVSSLGLGKYKVGKDIKIENGYRLVTVHYNEVCDCLHEGNYKIDSLDMPRLFNACRKRLIKGNLKSVTGDIYYVNLKDFELGFSCKENAKVKTYTGVSKVKAMGEFTFSVTDASIFMQNLCSEYSIIKNKIALRDITTIVSSDIAYLLKKKLFDLADILKNEEQVKMYLLNSLEKMESEYGIKVKDVTITDVKMPKGYEKELESVKESINAQDDLLQEAEINSSTEVQEEPVFVVVGGQGNAPQQNTFVQDDGKNTVFEPKNDNYSSQMTQNVINNNSSYIYTEQREPNLIEVEKDESLPQDNNVGAEQKVESSPSVAVEQNKPSIEETAPVADGKDQVQDNAKEGENEAPGKICPCCGIENPIDAITCRVCNSNF